MIKVTSNHLKTQRHFYSINEKMTKIKNEENSAIIKKFIEEEKISKEESNGSKKREPKNLKYILVGNVIKVYIVQENGVQQYLKSIPLKNVSADILLQVEDITFVDIIMILEMQNDGKKEEQEKNNYQSKSIGEYLKHQDGANIPYKSRKII